MMVYKNCNIIFPLFFFFNTIFAQTEFDTIQIIGTCNFLLPQGIEVKDKEQKVWENYYYLPKRISGEIEFLKKWDESKFIVFKLMNRAITEKESKSMDFIFKMTPNQKLQIESMVASFWESMIVDLQLKAVNRIEEIYPYKIQGYTIIRLGAVLQAINDKTIHSTIYWLYKPNQHLTYMFFLPEIGSFFRQEVLQTFEKSLKIE